MRGEKQENFTKEVLDMEEALKGNDIYSHHQIFKTQLAILTIVKKSEPKCQSQHTSEVDLHIYLCEPGKYKQIDKAKLSISKRATFSSDVRNEDGVININITASHGSKRKKYSLKYYQ